MTKRILLVEDEAMLLLFASMALEDEGYEVVTAADGVQGLKIARERAPDVIVTDYMMPEMDGIAMLQTLRDDGVLVPSIVASAIPQQQLPLNAKALTKFYIGKPYDETRLSAAVRSALEDKV